MTTTINADLSTVNTSSTSILYTALDTTTAQYDTAASASTSHSGLSNNERAILGGVLGGIGGLALICALSLLFVSMRRRKRKTQPVQMTPQRMSTARTPVSRFVTAFSSSSARPKGTPVRRTPKRKEEASPTLDRSFQALAGRRVSSSSPLDPSITRESRGSIDSRDSAYTTPSRRAGYRGSPSPYRTGHLPDILGRSQDAGSTTSHMSRFVERIDDI